MASRVMDVLLNMNLGDRFAYTEAQAGSAPWDQFQFGGVYFPGQAGTRTAPKVGDAQVTKVKTAKHWFNSTLARRIVPGDGTYGSSFEFLQIILAALRPSRLTLALGFRDLLQLRSMVSASLSAMRSEIARISSIRRANSTIDNQTILDPKITRGGLGDSFRGRPLVSGRNRAS
jgi:hypothetical protein